jgi:MFS superfamily sulfate permease-like transporter
MSHSTSEILESTTNSSSGASFEWGRELSAGLVVFLVALPLCLGIALASRAPLFAGLITGIVGGTVVALASGSSTSVSGPAAGLTVLVAHAIEKAGSFRAFLTALCVAGVMQFVLGVARAGVFGSFIPSTVIRGLLAAIGAILVLKQIPHAVGFVGDFDGDMEFAQIDGRNTFSEIPFALGHLHVGATLIALSALGAMLALERLPKERRPRWMPGPLLAVLVGLALNELFVRFVPALAVPARLRVALPAIDSASALRAQLVFPDPSALLRTQTWSNAATLAIVASVETLLSIEAVDKLDPLRRSTPPNRELQAQGLGNLIAGLLGGIPMTAVVVRSSANVQAGGRTRWSAVVHGVLLLLATAVLWPLLNRVPLSALAAVLLLIGYRLTPIRLFPTLWRRGWAYSAPFFATFAGIIVTDLLKGVAVGMLVAIFIVLPRNVQRAIAVQRDGEMATVALDGHVSFLHKSLAIRRFEELASAREITIDGSSATHIDPDIVEVLHDLAVRAKERGATVVLKAIPDPIGLAAH